MVEYARADADLLYAVSATLVALSVLFAWVLPFLVGLFRRRR